MKVCEDELSVAAFNDVGELENHFRSLQVQNVDFVLLLVKSSVKLCNASADLCIC